MEITVIEQAKELHYQPGYLYVSFMELPSDVMFRSQKKVLSSLVKLVEKLATKIDINARKVQRADWAEYPYIRDLGGESVQISS